MVTGTVPLSLAETSGDPLPSLGTSGDLTKKRDSPADPLPMEVCENNGKGPPPDSQKTSESEQPASNSTKNGDSPADPLPMEVCQNSGKGPPPGSQETSELEQPASTGQDTDIVDLQLKEG